MARAIDADRLLQELMKMEVLTLDRKDLFTGPARIAVFGMIGEQPTLTPPNEWVSVEERLPEPTYCVLVYTTDFSIEVDAIGSDGEWISYEVTHWMYLPVPPAKGGER